ncbi:hypothetical protein SARC_01226 [Sphaeroforma arctica JP610]|uniref:Eukaryotic translation initiation factor 4E n=1 Tax=Sphaeroforma arctica JP610 TaxID=667725 RepID=A0A0L0GCC3_9EUKA|nr:hypothetical protein SARC_01226 [Sphaeroforma arctica JP610]KNC86647.1 hypothetical protein SARC_01226 [Sphaeroforma arctica JP610]|eukprot:XP_014160549.1 hypothetical protein SARC_01226 [Sphaeroforma arctica JP610]
MAEETVTKNSPTEKTTGGENTVFDDKDNFTVSHPLSARWVLWFDIPKHKVEAANWMATLKTVYTITTIEEFWGVINNMAKASQLPAGSNFHFFKEGVKPMWEDPENLHGGKWIISTPVQSGKDGVLDRMWIDTMLAVIGQVLTDSESEVCGCVCSPRKAQNRIALWTKSGDQRKIQEDIAKKWKVICQYEAGLSYQVHSEASKRNSSFNNDDKFTA